MEKFLQISIPPLLFMEEKTNRGAVVICRRQMTSAAMNEAMMGMPPVCDTIYRGRQSGRERQDL